MPPSTPEPGARSPYDVLVAAIFAAGLAMSLVMVARSQVTEDQMNLLARGWRFASEGEWLW